MVAPEQAECEQKTSARLLKHDRRKLDRMRRRSLPARPRTSTQQLHHILQRHYRKGIELILKLHA